MFLKDYVFTYKRNEKCDAQLQTTLPNRGNMFKTSSTLDKYNKFKCCLHFNA